MDHIFVTFKHLPMFCEFFFCDSVNYLDQYHFPSFWLNHYSYRLDDLCVYLFCRPSILHSIKKVLILQRKKTHLIAMQLYVVFVICYTNGRGENPKISGTYRLFLIIIITINHYLSIHHTNSLSFGTHDLALLNMSCLFEY